MPSLSVSTKFGEEGETDLFFYKRHIGFHIIDRAIRLSDGCEVPNKFKETLLDAYTTVWFQRHGPFKFLYTEANQVLPMRKQSPNSRILVQHYGCEPLDNMPIWLNQDSQCYDM